MTQTIALDDSHRTHRAGSRVLGRADAHEWCEVTLKLARRAPLPEPTTKGAPTLSREELGARHGADPTVMRTVVDAMTRRGLALVSEDAATRTVRLSGSVAAMEAAFDTHLLRVAHEGRVYRGRVGALHVPAEIAGHVVGVFGLDERRMARHRRPMHAHAVGHALPPASARPWFLPAELASLYAFPSGTGAGQTIGLIELGGEYVPSDLALFAKAAGMTRVPEVLTVEAQPRPASERHDADMTGEVMLDVEVAAHICPEAKIVCYFARFTEQGWLHALDAAIHDAKNRPDVLSISWGFAEGDAIWTPQAMKAIDEALHEAAVLGIPVCIAAGDDGSSDQVDDGRAYVDFPASSPFALAIGGTAIHKHGGRHTESVWKDGDGLRADRGGSTGGGVSAFFDRPSWQKVDVASVNPGAKVGRVVPDVAANAAGSTGYLMAAGGNLSVSGGTSAATPLWAALIARLNAAGKQLRYPTPLFYGTDAATQKPLGSVVCHDIRSGDNDTAAAGGYHARAGYDAVTGWGSPIGDRLHAHL